MTFTIPNAFLCPHPPVILALFCQIINDEKPWSGTPTTAGLRHRWVQEQFLLLKELFIRNYKPGMADRAKLYQAPRPTRTDSNEGLGLSRKPATGHVVGMKGKEVETTRGSARANDAEVGTRYDQDLDSSKQLPAIKGLASSASPQKARLGQGPVKTSTQDRQPTQPQASKYPPASLGEDKSFQGSSSKERR